MACSRGWPTSQALPFIIGGDVPCGARAVGGCVGGFVVAPLLATVTPSHRVIDFFVVSRDRASACEATTQISHYIAPHRPDAGGERLTLIGTRCAGVSGEPQERRRCGRPSSTQWRRSSPTRF